MASTQELLAHDGALSILRYVRQPTARLGPTAALGKPELVLKAPAKSSGKRRARLSTCSTRLSPTASPMFSGKLKTGWTRVAFGDVVRLSKERTSDPAASGLERYVGLEHLDPGDLQIRRWGDVATGTTFTSVFRLGQVLFGKRRAYQRKVGVPDFSGVCSSDIYVFESKDDRHLLPELLPFICQSEGFFDHAIGTSAGSLSPRTNWQNLLTYEFVLVPLDEQRRIVRLLSSAISTLGAYRVALLGISTSVMNALIHRFDRQMDETFMGTLGEITCRLESGRSPAGSARPAGQGEHGVLKVSSVGDWSFFESENKRIPSTCFDESLGVKMGDFLVIRANADPDSVGRTCVVREPPSNSLMLSDKTWRLVLKKNIGFDALGVLAWTKSNRFRRHLRSQIGGTDAKNISKERFLAAPFPTSSSSCFVGFNEMVRQIRRSSDEIQVREGRVRAFYKDLQRKTLGP